MRYSTAIKIILTTALPFSLARLVQVMGDFASIGLLAQLGTLMLAACSLIIACQTLVIIPLTAVLNAIIILINPNDASSAGKVLRNAWAISVLLSIPAMLFFWFSESILYLFDQPTQLVAIVRDYLCIYAFSIPFIFALYANQQFAMAIKKPSLAFISTAFNVAITLIAAYGFIFGEFGLPNLAERGLGVATFIASFVTFFGMTLYFWINKKEFQQYEIFDFNFSTSLMKHLFLKGTPIGIFVATEIMAMSVATFLVGLLGQDALTSQQASSAYLYMLTSLLIAGAQAAAANVRVQVWQRNFDQAKMLGNVAINLWTVFSIVAAGVLCIFPSQLLSLFIDKNTSTSIFDLAILLLQIHAIGLIFDAIRNLATGALRALGDVKTSMQVGFTTTCSGALILGYLLGIQYGWGAAGIYIARDIGLALGATILLIKWLQQWKGDMVEVNT